MCDGDGDGDVGGGGNDISNDDNDDLPRTGYIQAQLQFSAQLKFLPRCMCDDCDDDGNYDDDVGGGGNDISNDDNDDPPRTGYIQGQLQFSAQLKFLRV